MTAPSTDTDWSYDSPSTWPLWVRRAFVVTLPISWPLWIASFLVMGVMAVVVSLPMMCAWAGYEVLRDWWRART